MEGAHIWPAAGSWKTRMRIEPRPTDFKSATLAVRPLNSPGNRHINMRDHRSCSRGGTHVHPHGVGVWKGGVLIIIDESGDEFEFHKPGLLKSPF